MSKRHDERATEAIAHEVALWIAREAGAQSLITVTRAELTSRGERAHIYVSVFPESSTKLALEFLERNAREVRDQLRSNVRLHPVPNLEFILDTGELNRQRLDELTRKP